MVWNWLRRHPNLVDTAIVLALAAGYLGRAGHAHQWVGGVPLALLQVVPLIDRRRHPRAVLAIVTGAFVIQTVVYTAIPPFALMVAVYTVAVSLPRSEGLVTGGAATAVATLTVLAVGDWHAAASYPVPLVAAWVIGDNLGTRRAYTRTLEERAARLEAEAGRARAEEQARIARELHDVIAHNVSVMVVQAAAANDVFDARPDRAREALQAIEGSGRKALDEMRRLLGVVRGEGADYAPQPGIEQLDELVERVRSAGLAVAVSVEGTPRPLPAAIELSAYRVVQEALTNTLKHAEASRADVALRFLEHELDVEIRDDGVGAGNGDGNGSGHGLIGMRERVAAFGGSLDAGTISGGGFAVAARFPL